MSSAETSLGASLESVSAVLEDGDLGSKFVAVVEHAASSAGELDFAVGDIVTLIR